MARIVCFDWGGVLIEIAPFSHACERAGVPMHDLPFGFPYDHEQSAGWRFERGEISYEEFCQLASEACAGSYTPDHIGAIHGAILIDEYPGAGELVAELNARPGVETALLSNTNARHFSRIPSLQGASRLIHKWSSHLLGHAKPDLRIFRAFEAKTGARADDILFFDDRHENIEAARAAGWTGELVPRLKNPIDHLRERLRFHRIL